VDISGDDDAWGWNAGLMWNITPDMRLGAHYRSAIKYDINGNINIGNPTVTLPPALAPIGGRAGSPPSTRSSRAAASRRASSCRPITNVSFYTRLNPKWEVMAGRAVHRTGRRSRPSSSFVRVLAGPCRRRRKTSRIRGVCRVA
jgi:long-subunit fatty acid transport protein